MPNNHHKLVGVIDEGTSTANFIIYKGAKLEFLCSHSINLQQIHPQEGWVEQDPWEIMKNVMLCIEEVCRKLTQLGYSVKNFICIGITNQRETTVVWDKFTGKPLYNAIVWNDNRTDDTVEKILMRIPERNKDFFKTISGLRIASNFSALKLRWLQDNVVAVRNACRDKRCLFGTIDSWVVWNLTGGKKDGIHVTDVTNASRTLLMNIETLHWDQILTKTFGVYLDMLPEIRSSSEIYGHVKNGSVLDGVPISGILGNQQASLVGQMCLQRGQAKSTYRTACFLLMNTGAEKVISSHGLMTTIAYKMGPKAPAVYALEGMVAIGGSALKWLHAESNLEMLINPHDSDSIDGSVQSTGDVYFVPAFKGLNAPYWRKDARAVICGLTAYTTRHHINLAALEAICFQTRDLLEAMKQDCEGIVVNELCVDGALTSNGLLMQLLTDINGIPVMKSQCNNPPAFGVAFSACQAEGIDLVHQVSAHPTCDVFQCTTTVHDRKERYVKWKMAVERTFGWAVPVVSSAKAPVKDKDKSDVLSDIVDPPSGIFSSLRSGFVAFGSFLKSAVTRCGC